MSERRARRNKMRHETMRLARPRAGGLLLGISLLAAACDPGPPAEAIGVTPASGEAQVAIVYVPCAGEDIHGVRVVRPSGGAVVGDEDDEVLWEVASPGGSPLRMFEVGVTPPGWHELVPMANDLGSSEEVAAMVDTNLAQTFILFKLADLRQGKVFTNGSNRSLSEFRSDAQSVCASPARSTN
jgi:hypothetical protein